MPEISLLPRCCTLAALAGLALASCSRTQESAPQALGADLATGLSADAVRPRRVGDALAEQTALLTLALHPDGSADLTGVSRRPFPFRGRQVVPFDPRRHEPPPLQAPSTSQGALPATGAVAPGASPTVAIGPPGGAVVPPSSATPPPPRPEESSYALVVRAPSRATPVVVPLDLGAPGEGGGDIGDRWSDETLIIRAPSFGDGTRYTLVRVGPASSVALSEREERP